MEGLQRKDPPILLRFRGLSVWSTGTNRALLFRMILVFTKIKYNMLQFFCFCSIHPSKKRQRRSDWTFNYGCCQFLRLYGVADRWMKYKYGSLVEWYWQGKTEVLGVKFFLVSPFPPQILYILTHCYHINTRRNWLVLILFHRTVLGIILHVLMVSFCFCFILMWCLDCVYAWL